MLFSVITINRNNAAGLEKTIRSVMGQTYTNFEYIIVDGASTDNSVEVIKREAHPQPFPEEAHPQPFPKGREFSAATEVLPRGKDLGWAPPCKDLGWASISWISEPDKGIYNAMNKGVRMAHGDYLLFLNSGDTFASETVIADIQAKDLRTDIVIGRINFIDAEGREHKDYQRVSDRHTLYGFRQSLIPHQAALIKRSAFLAAGPYDEKYRIVADWQFFLKAILQHECTYCTIPVTIANFDNGGISSNNGDAMMEEINKAFKETLPACLVDDYLWAEKHHGDIARIEWLDRHKMIKKLINAIVLFGRKISK